MFLEKYVVGVNGMQMREHLGNFELKRLFYSDKSARLFYSHQFANENKKEFKT